MKIKNLLLIVIGIFILSSCGQKMNNKVTLKNEKDSISYIIGVDIANSLKNVGVEEINYNNFVAGLNDAMEENELKIEEAKLKPYMQQYFAKLQEKKRQEMEIKKVQNLEDGKKFLEENKEKEGIIVTESGLQYEIIEEGTGKSPEETSLVVCHYKGTFLDGTEFDNSYKNDKPAEFKLNGVIKGWTEGVQLMKEGAKYKFYIPAELAYGERGRPNIEPNMALVFEIELIEVKEVPVPQKKN